MGIEERVEKLERSVRRWRTLVVIMMLAFVGLNLLGNVSGDEYHEVIRCKGLKIEDGSGNVRGIFQVTNEGVGVFLHDASGRLRVKFGMLESGPGLAYYDTKGKNRAAFGMFENGPGIALNDTKGKTRAKFELFEMKPKLSFYDSRGTRRIGMAVAERGQGISMYDYRGNVRTTLDDTGLDVRDSQKRLRIMLKQLEDGPHFKMWGPLGEVKFEQPQ